MMKTPHQNQILAAVSAIDQRLQHIEEKLNHLSPAKPEWLDNLDVCNLLHISKRTLESYREKGYLSYTRIGGRIFYSQSAIDDWLNSHMVRKEERK